MTVTEIRSILESPYNRRVWKSFIQTQFTNNKLNVEDRAITLSDKTLSKQCLTLGNYEVDEYTKIGIFEVELNEKVNITRNRVALRNLIKDITKQVSGAMVVFVQGDKWRFSYISKRKIKNNDTNEIHDKETAPKRYTYLFGKNEKALTAAIRFDKLIQKQKENIFQFLTLNDFEDAFSVEKLSKEFFNKYKEAYEDFVQFLTGKRYEKRGNKYVEQVIHEPNWQLTALFKTDEKQARDFCKRMMGRIVFLYFIQKKGWLSVAQNKKWGEGNPDYMFDLFTKSKDKQDFYHEDLVPLFFKTLNNPDSEKPSNGFRFPYLNGGLFNDSHDKLFNRLQLPEPIFRTLFETFNNFNFTVYEDAPDEHTVAVDPEMLGHIFENLLEDNKDKGAFYTPKEIVHYMCKESLKAYLLAHSELHFEESKIAKTTIENIIQQQELSNEEKQFAENNAYKIIDALDHVKICDPAIGSGAFPMGLLQEVFNAQIYLQELKGFKKAKTDADIKKHIIEESIYGVDIDAGAVDIARLRFWLSLVVDEQEPQPLPNLDFKIVCANSIVELGALTYDDVSGNYKIVEQLAEVRHKYFSASKQVKEDLEKEFNTLQNALYKNAKEWISKADGEIYKKLLDFSPFKNESCGWFDEKWMLGIKDGFDIVIGNPPYIKEYTNKDAFEGFRKSKYYQGKMDLWYGFACVLIDKLKPNGVQCFIAQNNWITSAGASKLRNKILTDTRIKSFIDFGNYKVFASAGIQTMIYLIQKAKVEKGEKYPVKYSVLLNENMLEENLMEFLDFDIKTNYAQKYLFQIASSSNNEKTFTFNTSDDEAILNEIAKASNYKFSPNEVAQGIVFPQDFLNKANQEILGNDFKLNEGVFALNTFEVKNLTLSKKEKELIKPYYTTENFKRFYANPENSLWLIYTDSTFKNPETIEPYPNLKKHLDRFEGIITSDNKPYGLHRSREERFFLEEKIIVQRKCADKPVFTYTDFTCYVSATFYVIKSFKRNHKFLTALLNSRLIEFWLRNKGKMQGNNFQLDKEPLLNIPLVIPKDVTPFETLVDYLLYLYDDAKPQALTHTANVRIASHIEDVLNMMTYELYFEKHMKENGIDVLKLITPKPISSFEKDEEKEKEILGFYNWLLSADTLVRQRIKVVDIKSPNLISKINSSTI